MLKRTLPTRVRRLRNIQGLSQVALASRAQIARAVLSEVEAGQSRNPRYETITRLAIALGVTPDYLTGFDRALILIADGPPINSHGKCCVCDGLLPPGTYTHHRSLCVALQEARGLDVEAISRLYEISVKQVIQDIHDGREKMRVKW